VSTFYSAAIHNHLTILKLISSRAEHLLMFLSAIYTHGHVLNFISSYLSADVKCRDNFFWTPLHHACHCGQLDIVQLLLDNGADIDAQAINGGTPLMRAIESSKEAVVSYLISKG
jgi:ankyrin repeat protein